MIEKPPLGQDSKGPVTIETMQNIFLSGTYPSAKVVEEFLRYINFYRRYVLTRLSWESDEKIRTESVQKAIETLIDYLPAERVPYVSHVEACARFGLDPTETQRDLEAIDALISAIDRVIERGLPHHSPMILSQSIEPSRKGAQNRWMQCAQFLLRAFRVHFPGQSKEAEYRFIQHVVPHLTGEAPTLAHVEKTLKADSKNNASVNGCNQ